jgi:hypothetical protein
MKECRTPLLKLGLYDFGLCDLFGCAGPFLLYDETKCAHGGNRDEPLP